MSFNIFGFFHPRKKMAEEGHDRNDMTKSHENNAEGEQ